MISVISNLCRNFALMIAASTLAYPAIAQDTQPNQNAEEEQQAGPASAANAALPEPNIEVVETKPEKPEKITDKAHPDYIRCKSESVIGSRARRKKTCMSNRDWALASRRGNEASRDFIGDNQAGFQPGSE